MPLHQRLLLIQLLIGLQNGHKGGLSNGFILVSLTPLKNSSQALTDMGL